MTSKVTRDHSKHQYIDSFRRKNEPVWVTSEIDGWMMMDQSSMYAM